MGSHWWATETQGRVNMMTPMIISLLVTGLLAAPPHLTSPTPKETTVANVEGVTKTLPEEVEVTTLPPSPPTFTQASIVNKPTPRLSAKERLTLISHLGEADLKTTDTLILTPRQQLAVWQEVELRELGLPAFYDPSPWERLTKEEKLTFNQKYLALPRELQEFAQEQFLSVPEDIQEHAYRMFLTLNDETLIEVLSRELGKEIEVVEVTEKIIEENEEENEVQELSGTQTTTEKEMEVFEMTEVSVKVSENDVVSEDEEVQELTVTEKIIDEVEVDVKELEALKQRLIKESRERELERLRSRRRQLEQPRSQQGVRRGFPTFTNRGDRRRLTRLDPRRG